MQNQDIWPELADNICDTINAWRSITIEKLNEFLSNNNINARTEYGRSTLMLASAHNSNKEVIQTLIDNGADVNARDEDGWTALMWASSNKSNPEMVKVLLDNGADLDARGAVYEITVLASLNNGNPEVIKVLINYIIKQGIEIDWNGIWELAQNNEDLKGTPVYWKINYLRSGVVLKRIVQGERNGKSRYLAKIDI